jgi:hypothetical protein
MLKIDKYAGANANGVTNGGANQLQAPYSTGNAGLSETTRRTVGEAKISTDFSRPSTSYPPVAGAASRKK